MGVRPVKNVDVLARTGQDPIVCSVRFLQLSYLGHLLRRGPSSPIWKLVYDRFLSTRVLGGPRRKGIPRQKWGRQ
eukprot:513137-Alexandrium_andersonii.AAC.1